MLREILVRGYGIFVIKSHILKCEGTRISGDKLVDKRSAIIGTEIGIRMVFANRNKDKSGSIGADIKTNGKRQVIKTRTKQ
jgi:hypothetical protein